MLAGAIALTIISALSVNWAYVREHAAASSLPPLRLTDPVETVKTLVSSRHWLTGFAVETGGFLCFVAALALAPLALVQSLAAGGVAVLAFVSSRASHVRLSRQELVGVAAAVLGLSLLGVSLSGSTGKGSAGNWIAVLGWLLASVLVTLAAWRFGDRVIGSAAAHGVGAGVLFAAGDVATKTVVSGELTRVAFVPAMCLAYGAGTTILQLGFQRGGALTTAGTATLLTNAIPIVAGTTLYGEPFPTGTLGTGRAAAFALVVAGGVLLARPQVMPKQGGTMRETAEVAAAVVEAVKAPA
jgi:hypothetical protein